MCSSPSDSGLVIGCSLPSRPRPYFRQHELFTPDDDRALRACVDSLGTSDWNAIAMRIQGRTPRQCKERWTNYLSPDLNGSPWTPDEDRLLLEKQSEIGNKWVRLSAFFVNRTDAMVKNRFHLLKRREGRGDTSQDGTKAGRGNYKRAVLRMGESLNSIIAPTKEPKVEVGPQVIFPNTECLMPAGDHFQEYDGLMDGWA
jgi:hypothetical protein